MNSDLETFNYFVDDILSLDADLLNYELDLLLMQYIFNSIDLEKLKEIDIQEKIIVAQQIMIMKYFYEKLWVPFFGGILSKLVFIIEGKPQNLEKNTKSKS